MIKFNNDWDEILGQEFYKPYYLALRTFLKKEYSEHKIYPNMFDIFNCFKQTPYNEVKALILGQDPYHGAGQAHGLCFSVPKGIEPPPSLKNIFKEIADDCGIKNLKNGDLTPWAQRGVLLMNTVLTVREASSNSHKGKGWEQLTDSVIAALNKRQKPIVFILWGANARAKIPLITNKNHLVLEACHPSPLSSYKFFGCRHFSKTNKFLIENNIAPIDWQL